MSTIEIFASIGITWAASVALLLIVGAYKATKRVVVRLWDNRAKAIATRAMENTSLLHHRLELLEENPVEISMLCERMNAIEERMESAEWYLLVQMDGDTAREINEAMSSYVAYLKKKRNNLN